MIFSSKSIYSSWVIFQYKHGTINTGNMTLENFILEGQTMIDKAGSVIVRTTSVEASIPFISPIPDETLPD